MEAIQNLINLFNVAKGFLTSNGTEIFAVIGAVYTIALFIVKLTPTPKDDEALAKVWGFLLGIASKIGVKK